MSRLNLIARIEDKVLILERRVEGHYGKGGGYKYITNFGRAERGKKA
jgi:hypothetical protein